MAASTWVVVRTFNRKEMEVSSFLRENGLNHFIPMTYRERVRTAGEKPQKVLVPVIHNYVFLEKSLDEVSLRSKLAECRVPVHLMQQKGDDHISEIPEREIVEFRLLCDPDRGKDCGELFQMTANNILYWIRHEALRRKIRPIAASKISIHALLKYISASFLFLCSSA